MREIAVPHSATRQIATNDLADALPLLPAQRVNASPSLQRPPSWADASCPPPTGAWCSCCKGGHWWIEAVAPKGWRCAHCHPPAHLGADDVREVRT